MHQHHVFPSRASISNFISFAIIFAFSGALGNMLSQPAVVFFYFV
jgi:hypothetical protein